MCKLGKKRTHSLFVFWLADSEYSYLMEVIFRLDGSVICTSEWTLQWGKVKNNFLVDFFFLLDYSMLSNLVMDNLSIKFVYHKSYRKPPFLFPIILDYNAEV